jgi:hypothetical protein
MASRKEEKERLRKEREEREREEEQKAAKKSRRKKLGIAGGVLLLALIVIGAVALSGGKKQSPAAAQEGLQETPAPWEPLTDGLEERESALGLPAPSETIYHVHAQLEVFVDGKRVTVPNNIGIDQGKGFLSSLHTHDEKGVMHMEAVEPYPFTVGQFLTVWGVKFTPEQLGAYKPGGGKVLETYLNGKKVPNGPETQLKEGDHVVVGYGKPGSFPKEGTPGPQPAS